MEPIRSIYEDDADMLEIVREFVAELPQRVADLEARFAEERFEELQTLAHQLKGAGGGYGFAQVTDAAANLEQALRDRAAPAALRDLCQVLCDTLRAAEVSESA